MAKMSFYTIMQLFFFYYLIIWGGRFKSQISSFETLGGSANKVTKFLTTIT